MNRSGYRTLPGALMILALAAWLRFEAAGLSYPAQGDAAHFVQHGVQWAVTGKPVSGYWSLAPQVLAGWAYRAGWDPARTLQVTTVLFGILLVGSVMGLARALGLSTWAMLCAGLIAAVNPVLLKSATGGLSETPLMALLITAYMGLERGQTGARRGGASVVAGLCLAGALYYRPFEAVVGIGAYAAYALGLHLIRTRTIRLAPLLVALAAFVAGAIPFGVLSHNLKATSAASSKLVNLAYREDGLDSKAMRSLFGPEQTNSALAAEIRNLEELGAVGYLWTNRGAILRKIPHNLMQELRILNGQVFDGAFSMGFIVFLLVNLALGVAIVRHDRWQMALLPLLYMGLIAAALSLAFVHPRWIYQFVPLYGLVLALGLDAWQTDRSRGRGWLVTAVVLVYAAKTAALGLEQRRDRWVELNVIPAGADLRALVAENEKLMAFGGELALEAKPDTPWLAAEMPYGTVAEVEAFAAREGVAWIILSSRNHAHYPIHEVTRNPELLPPTWTLVREKTFRAWTRWGEEEDTYHIYTRQDAP